MSSSYAHVTKGYLTHSQCIKAVHSQCDLELGRPLSLEEEKTLFQTISPKCIVERIQKVGILRLFIISSEIVIVWLRVNQILTDACSKTRNEM